MTHREGIAVALLFIATSPLPAVSQTPSEKSTLHRPSTNDSYSWFTINNLFNWYGNNGNSSYNISWANSGLEYPKGSGKTAVFEDGIVWGGFHKGASLPKVGGSQYRYGLQTGAITAYGGPTDSAKDLPKFDNPTLPKYRVYRVRPDITLSTTDSAALAEAETEAALIGRYRTITAEEVLDQYRKDWNEWPAQDCLPAPYTDVDKDGKYDPAVDIPGHPGAPQTLYYVANDLNAGRVNNAFHSAPIGLEMHRTVWGYPEGTAITSTIFASTLIINKSGATVDSMYLMQWADPDVGDAGDDYAGCDVARNLGFAYNGRPSDYTYGTDVPAVGYRLLQGPFIRTGNPEDSATFRGQYRTGCRNLKMTSFFVCAPVYSSSCNAFDSPGNPVEWYRIMVGRHPTTDVEFVNPISGEQTKFQLDGDPVRKQGWVDESYPGDRRIYLTSGPFTLANGDTQEIVLATIIGDGADRLSSVNVLKHNSDVVQALYTAGMDAPTGLTSPEMYASVLDQAVILSWADSIGGTKVEKWRSAGFAFEGYNVYQFPGSSPDLSAARRIATYDIVNSVTTVFDDVVDPESGYMIYAPVQFGTDGGIRRSFTTWKDAFSDKPLANGSTYYFGVTSYSVNTTPGFPLSALESTPRVMALIPQSALSGTAYHASAGDTLPVAHTAGRSTATGHASVIDPTRVAEKVYQIRIIVTDSVMNPDLGVNVPNPRWTLFDASTNQALTEPSSDFTFNCASPIVDGLQVGMSLPASSTSSDVTVEDRWEFASRGLVPTVGDRSIALAQLDQINVYPNPYLGYNPRETNKYQRFVTFIHLPERATIRIFNLAGVLVRTLIKDQTGQFYRWDLLNEQRYRVGAGMYIVHIEAPDLGRSKVLKLAVFPEIQWVDHW
jgi:hypothetical protein